MNEPKEIVKENLEKVLGEISPIANVYLCICDQGNVRAHSLLGRTTPHKAIGDLNSVIEAYRADIIRLSVLNTVLAHAKKPKIYGAFGAPK